MLGGLRQRAAFAVITSVVALGGAQAASSSGIAAVFHHPIAVVGTSQSSNWSGYNQGALEDGNEMYTSVSGTWTVPKVSQHTPTA
jgi:hypothetical protein